MKRRLLFIFEPFLKFPIFTASCAFCLGIIFSDFVQVESMIWITTVLFFAVAILLKLNKQKARLVTAVILFVLFFLFGVLRILYFEYRYSLPESVSAFDGKTVKVQGIVTSEIYTHQKNQRIIVNPQKIDIEGESSGSSTPYGNLLIKVFDVRDLEYGDEVEILGYAKLPQDFEGFSYREYLKAQKVFVMVEVEEMKIINKAKGNKVLISIFKLKQAISSKVSKILPQPHASLLCGVIYGEERGMSEEFTSSLQVTGTTHIIAVSGYNITVLISSLGIFKFLFSKKLLNIITIALVIFFMFFVGISNIPVVRASMMGIVFIIGNTMGRKRAIIGLLALVIAILMLINPLTYILISFQLSFLSTIGLIVMTDVLKKRLKIIPEFFREDVASTLSAILFTLPVTLMNFGEFSIIAPIVNFFVLPSVPLITVFGLIFVLTLMTIPFIGELLAPFVWLPLEYVIRVIRIFGNMDFAMATLSDSFGRLVTYVLIAILLIFSIEISFKNSAKFK